MESWHVALLLKPLGLVVIFSFVFLLARALERVIPEGRVKRILFYRWKV